MTDSEREMLGVLRGCVPCLETLLRVDPWHPAVRGKMTDAHRQLRRSLKVIGKAEQRLADESKEEGKS